jgi:tetrahydromethanopterin S-methyltransferase subunit B
MPDEEEREVRKPKKKYTRRETIKYGAKVGIGAALWGTVGNILGRGYGAGRDFYRSEVKPTLDKAEKAIDKVEELADDANRTFNPWYEPKPKEKSLPEQQKLTRRGFLKSLALQAHENPVAAGTLVGATYGAGKYTLANISNYLTKRQIAKLKDENADYRERLDILDQYRIGAEKDLKGKTERIERLEKSIDELREGIKRQGKLEEKTGGELEEIFLALGISGLLISVGFGSKLVTGKIISGIESNQLFPLTVAVFIISLLLLFLGIKKKN